MSAENLLVMQCGGPTPVLNATLSSILDESYRTTKIDRTFGAISGIAGLTRGDLVDLSDISPQELAQLKESPGAALGTSRSKPSSADLDPIVRTLRRFGVRYALFIGGNGTMRGAEVVSESCRNANYEIQVIGVPKTVDNDIAGIDRCPGYASAARYVAQSTRDLGADVRSLPQPVSIFETMGRSVGWLAAASVAAKNEPEDAPHLVYVPETPFDTETFLSDLDRVVTRLGWAIVVVSEGLRRNDGELLYQSTYPSQVDALQRPLPGGVGQYLAGIVTQRLRIRCRSEQPGLLGRSSMLHVSSQDRKDAELIGRAAVHALLEGHTNQMVSLLPLNRSNARNSSNASGYDLVPLSQVAGKERPIPAAWLSGTATAVNDGFVEYIRPLIGSLAEYHAPFRFSFDTLGVS